MMKQLVVMSICMSALAFGGVAWCAEQSENDKADVGSVKILPFGKGGKIKMLYDRRKRPQSVYLNDKLYIVYNGNSKVGKNASSAAGCPLFIAFDPATQLFSEPVQLAPGHKDHHFAPILWADDEERLHTLMRCHKTEGTHLVVDPAGGNALNSKAWKKAAPITDSISYPSVYTVADGKQVIYFRYEGHRGAWRFLISDDHAKTWGGPESYVTDLNRGDDLRKVPVKEMDERSAYQSCFPSADGKFLHVVFAWYDDNKSGLPEKFYNPRYGSRKNLGIKYNLYYVKIDLGTHAVMNFEGETLQTPIDIDQANAQCLIWDTEWRGAGVPPDILLDENGTPSFLHVLTEDDPQTLSYYYVAHDGNQWTQSRIASSNHEWNSGSLLRDEQGVLHAYLIVGDQYLEGGFNDIHGGGRIEEWISNDHGTSWKKYRELTPDTTKYPGWRFNNFRPVRRPDRSPVESMFLFYGWDDPERSTAESFLLIDN